MPDIIRKDFSVPLPSNFSSLVAVGDPVTAGQVIARASDAEQIVNIPEHLKIPLKKVKNVLKKNPGDPIHKGDVIAERKSMLGFDKAAIISNIDGIVFRYERNTGNLVLRTSFDAPENVISPVDGTVALCDNEQIVITLSRDEEESEADIQPDADAPSARLVEQKETAGTGGDAEGELFVLEKSFSDDLNSALYDLDSRAVDTIVLGGTLTREILMKGIGIGVKGFLGADIRKEDLEFIVTKHPGTPIIQTDEETVASLKQLKGKRVGIEGEAKILRLQL